MKITKALSSILAKLFAHNPKSEVLFVASDNQAFEEAARADSYAQRLADQKVLTITRSDFEAGNITLETERAQEAGEGKMKTVETIPSEVIDLSTSGHADAATAAEEANLETKASLSVAEDIEVEKNKLENKGADKAIKEVKEDKQSETKAEDKKPADELEAERQGLFDEYEKLAGKKANHKTGIEKLKTLIAEEKAKKA